MPPNETDAVRVDTVRDFNRFYTRRIGVLHESLSQSRFTLTEARLLWEFAHRNNATATELSRDLELDTGYLSRLLSGFKQQGLIKATRSTQDARRMHLSITAAGRRAFAPLNTRSQADVNAMLATLTDTQQRQLLQSMAAVKRLLGEAPRQAAPYLLRAQHAGDIGWVISRHGALYAREYGLDARFEALVARIAADFIDHFDATREACWIAERDDTNVGCVFLVQARDEQTREPLAGCAQLRMLLVEPAARGLGIGQRLVSECERFARSKGYHRIVLWTQSALLAARTIYSKADYHLVKTEPHHSFGHDLVGEIWELDLS
jgi:DNA-binding MarR family transcriptional regulator/predicted N-acetyltransferase YhbS